MLHFQWQIISIRHLDARDQLLLPKVDLEPDRLAALLDLRIITGMRKRKLIKCFRSSSLYKFHFCEIMMSTWKIELLQILCHESGCGCDLPRDQGRYTALFLLNTQLVLFSLASPYTNTNTHNLIRSSSFGKHEFFQALIMSLKYIMRLILVKKLIRIIKKYPQRFYLHLIIIIALFITLL